ncbi:MAG: DNA repair protein RecO [Spirochaetes bacterium]|nr:DNA repair protein RecO [Spirochaetota bacterium]
MKISKHRGIVLKTSVIKEADVCASILTPDGCGKFIFKGLKKSRKRDTAAAYPGSIIEFNVYERGSFIPIVSNFSVVFFPSNITSDLSKLSALNCILEIIFRTTAEKDPHSNMIVSAENYLSMLNSDNSPFDTLNMFILEYLSIHGIMPDLIKCHSCGKISEQMILSFRNKALVCEQCFDEKIIARFRLEFNDVRYIAGITENKDIVTDSRKAELALLFLNYVENYYHVEFNSKKLFGGIYD